jgi:hypothetical protein
MIDLDLAENVFQAHGAAKGGSAGPRKWGSMICVACSSSARRRGSLGGAAQPAKKLLVGTHDGKEARMLVAIALANRMGASPWRKAAFIEIR